MRIRRAHNIGTDPTDQGQLGEVSRVLGIWMWSRSGWLAGSEFIRYHGIV
jgi:hypothetical protein